MPGLNADVFHSQRKARLIAKDGFVLCPMVLKDPIDIFLTGADNQIHKEDDNLQQTLQQIPPPQGKGREEMQQSAGEEGGQHHKQKDAHSHAQHNRQSHQDTFQLFAGKVPLQPQFKLGGLGGLLIGVKICRIHQSPYAMNHGVQEVDGSADQRNPQNGVPVPDKPQLLDFFHQLSFLIPDHNGFFLRSTHQDALDQRLSANAGAEGAGLVLCHEISFL